MPSFTSGTLRLDRSGQRSLHTCLVARTYSLVFRCCLCSLHYLSVHFRDNMIKNHFNASLQRQKRLTRQRNNGVGPGRNTAHGKDKCSTDAPQTSTSPEYPFASSSSDVPPSQYELDPSSSNLSSPTLNKSKFTIDPLRSSASKSSSLSNATSTDCLPHHKGLKESTLSSHPSPNTSYASSYEHSPAVSSSNPSGARAVASPVTPVRTTHLQPRPLYHPYARYGYQQPERRDHYGSSGSVSGNSDTNGSLSSMHAGIFSSPVASGYPPPTDYALDYPPCKTLKPASHVPLSAPPGSEHFNIRPDTPARRCVLTTIIAHDKTQSVDHHSFQ